MHLNQSHPTIAWLRRYIRPGFVVTAAVIVFVLFFNDNSLLTTYEHDKEIAVSYTHLTLPTICSV